MTWTADYIMNSEYTSTKNHNSTSFFFRHRVLKIIILLIGHILGLIVFAILAFLLAEYIIGELSIMVDNFFGGIWNNFTLNLLPPLIIGLSFVVLLVSNPIYALVSLILIFFNTALFLIGTHVEFLALIYILIYIGAIAILFLFVIMMFNLKELQDSTTWSQNKDFLSISFIFYLFVLSKFYYMFLNLVLNYVEYDTYFNDFLTLKYELLFKSTQDYYTAFIRDIHQALVPEVINWNASKAELASNSQHLSTISFDAVPTNYLNTLYGWYMNRTDIMLQANIDTYWNWKVAVHQKSLDSTDSLLNAYVSPIDISIIGSVLYTYYSYLFLLATLILFIAMIGAIILALSTSERKEVSKNLFKPNF